MKAKFDLTRFIEPSEYFINLVIVFSIAPFIIVENVTDKGFERLNISTN